MGRQSRFAYAPRVWGFFRKHPHSKTIREYATLGRAEGWAIQRRVWGREPPRFLWLAMLMATKAWGTAALPLGPRPRWPASLVPIRRAPWREKMASAFHEGSRAQRVLRRLGLAR
jgi:hypothetical protein